MAESRHAILRGRETEHTSDVYDTAERHPHGDEYTLTHAYCQADTCSWFCSGDRGDVCEQAAAHAREHGATDDEDLELTECFLVIHAPGEPGGYYPRPQTEEAARAWVEKHGGTLRRRWESPWRDDG